MILAADVGGTKTLLALYEVAGEQLIERKTARLESHWFTIVEEMLAEFLKEVRVPIEVAIGGVLEPIRNNQNFTHTGITIPMKIPNNFS